MRFAPDLLRPLLIGVVSAMVLLTLSSVPGAAFSLEGHYWQTNSDAIPCAKNAFPTLPPVACTIRLDNTYFTLADWQNTSDQASAQWTLYDSTDGHLIFQYGLSGNIGQVFMYQQDLGGYNKSGNIVLGTTNYSWVGNAMTQANIYINDDSAITWCTFTEQTGSGCSATSYVLEST